MLENSSNPFAVMIMAHLKTKATQGQPEQRQQWKWDLIRRLFEQGYDKNDIRQLFRLVDWMMTLPEELQKRFETQVTQYQEERKMPLLSHMELRAEKRGEQRGKQIGLEIGSLQTARESVLDILNVRFGEVPEKLTEAISELEDLLLLKKLQRPAILVESVEAFQQFLSEQLENENQSNLDQ